MIPPAPAFPNAGAKRRLCWLAPLALLIALVAASPAAAGPSDGVPGQQPTARSQARLVATQLQPARADVVDVTPYDDDGLLGLPGQYTSKVTFRGGSIEVFATPADRDSRMSFLDGSGQYFYPADFNAGSVLLRIDSDSVTSKTEADRIGRSLALAAAVLQ